MLLIDEDVLSLQQSRQLLAVGGSEFQVNTDTTLIQDKPSVAGLTDGGFVVAWQSDGQDGDRWGIYAQRYDALGLPVGGEFQVNTYTTSFQTLPSVAGLTDGGFVVTWQSDGQDDDGWGVYAQSYDASGVPFGGEFQVDTTNTVGFQLTSAVAGLTNGEFVITWESGSSRSIYAQRYNSSIAAVGNKFRVNTYTALNQISSAVTDLVGGGFVVTWTSDNGQDGSEGGIFGQRFDASGVAVGDEFQVNNHTALAQRYSSVAGLTDGGFVVAWESNEQDGSAYGIYAQRYAAGGVVVGDEFQVNTHTASFQDSVSVTGLTDGGFLVTWQSLFQGGIGNTWDIYAQRYDVSGVAVGDEFQVNASPGGNLPSVTDLTSGEFVVVWTSVAGADIFARIGIPISSLAPTIMSTAFETKEETLASTREPTNQVTENITNMETSPFSEAFTEIGTSYPTATVTLGCDGGLSDLVTQFCQDAHGFDCEANVDRVEIIEDKLLELNGALSDLSDYVASVEAERDRLQDAIDFISNYLDGLGEGSVRRRLLSIVESEGVSDEVEREVKSKNEAQQLQGRFQQGLFKPALEDTQARGPQVEEPDAPAPQAALGN